MIGIENTYTDEGRTDEQQVVVGSREVADQGQDSGDERQGGGRGGEYREVAEPDLGEAAQCQEGNDLCSCHQRVNDRPRPAAIREEMAGDELVADGRSLPSGLGLRRRRSDLGRIDAPLPFVRRNAAQPVQLE